MSRSRPIVAIDGPAGVGKSTTARLLAERLGYVFFDTGALYRAVALVGRDKGIGWDDPDRLAVIAQKLDLEFRPERGAPPRVLLGGTDRTEDIRSPEISTGASVVSKYPQVRAALLDRQRALGAQGGIVLEGRDTGTVVFPDAEVKVFLTASPEERARRRVRDLAERGVSVDFQETLGDIERRDERDSSRAVAPLVAAEDAWVFDSTELNLEQVLDALAAHVRERSG